MCFLHIKSSLNKVFRNNTVSIELNPNSKIVLFSDLHRGIGDWADDFMHNSLIFSNALHHYLNSGFTYIELGDGDELYENRRLVDIVRAHGDIYWLLNQFHEDNRLVYLWGNHNLQMRNRKWREKALREACSHIQDLFLDLEVHETVMLGDKIFLFHGHQGDAINDMFAPLGRFMVRNFWRPLQTGLGMKDPTSPAQNVRKRNKMENAILDWAREKKVVAIAGHTHRPMFSSLSKQQRETGLEEEPYYFNCGSGVHPRCVTCLEIQDMGIELVKWHVISDPKDERRLRVIRQPIEGCREKLDEIFSQL